MRTIDSTQGVDARMVLSLRSGAKTLGRSRWEERGEAMDCSHVDHIRDVAPTSSGCDECSKDGDVWVQLRMCMQCGHVGCCDSSKNKHAARHFRATVHPIVRSLGAGEEWGWCFVDRLWFEKLPRPPREGQRP